MERKSKLLSRFTQLKKLIQQNKQLYTIYSNPDTNEHTKIVSIQTITDDMNSKSLINVMLENGVEIELRYWEITPYTQKEFNPIN